MFLCRECPTELLTDHRIIDTIEGETFKIKCGARDYKVDPYRSWKKCKWERMRDNSSCRFIYHKIAGKNQYEIWEKCVGLKDHYFFGEADLYTGKGNPYCGLNVNPTRIHDEGLWKCSIVFEDPMNKSLCIASTLILVKVTLCLVIFKIKS